MLWEVRGILGGQEIKTNVEASSADSARSKAAAKGVTVTSVSASSVPSVAASAPVTRAASDLPAEPQTFIHGQPAQPIQIGIAMPAPVAHKGVSGFGIASLILALIAIAICWIPFIGVISVPFAIIALLLSFIGFLVSLIGGHSGVGMPVAGGVTAAIALVIFFVVTSGTVAALNGAARRAASQQRYTVPSTAPASQP